MEKNQIKVSDIKISERTAKLIEARQMVADAWLAANDIFVEKEEEGNKAVCTPDFFDNNLKYLFKQIDEYLTDCLEDSIYYNRKESNKTII